MSVFELFLIVVGRNDGIREPRSPKPDTTLRLAGTRTRFETLREHIGRAEIDGSLQLVR